jgi:hypothetical protein
MSKRFLAAALPLGLLAAAGWALAQRAPPAGTPGEVVPPPAAAGQKPPPVVRGPSAPAAAGQKPAPVVADPSPSLDAVAAPARGAPPKGVGAPGRYAVALSGERGLLVDTATGRTWELRRGAGGRSVWAPVRRLGSGRDFQQWLDRQKALGADRKAKERKEARATREAERQALAKEQEAARAAVRDERWRLQALKVQQDKARAEQEDLLQALKAQQEKARAEQDRLLKELRARERQLRLLQDRLDAALRKQGK